MKNKAMLEAALNNDIAKLHERIQLGENVNDFSSASIPPISLTSYFGNHEASKFLIMNGALINHKDKDWMVPLHYAALGGSDESIRILLNAKADLNCRDKRWRTPLHIAAGNANVEAFELITSRSKTLHIVDRLGWSALHHAAYFGCLENIIILINKGVNIKDSDKNNCTPLHFAALNGHLKVVSHLINRGALVDVYDKRGLTPLHYATIGLNDEVCRMLVLRGAKPDIPSRLGNTPLHLACLLGEVESIDFYIDVLDELKSNPNCLGQTHLHLGCIPQTSYLFINQFMNEDSLLLKDKFGRTPIHYLAIQGNLAGWMCITRYEFNVDIQDDKKWTPLHYACNNNHYDMAAKIISHGADVLKSTIKGQTALHLAISTDNIDIVKLLIEHGSKLDAVDNYNKTCLHYAILYKKFNLIDLLISPHVLEICDKNGLNVLHYTASSSNYNLAQKLLSLGMDINALDSLSRTPLHYSSFFDETGCITQLLLQHGAILSLDKTGFYPIHYAVYNKKVENVQNLMTNFNVDTESIVSSSLLHIMMHNGFTEFLLPLLNYYPNNRIPMIEKGITPIHIAAAKGDIISLDILIKYFNNVNIHTAETSQGCTPVHFAALLSNIDCLKCLLETTLFSYDINTKTDSDLTALAIALTSGGSDAIVRFLIKKGANVNIPFSSLLIYPVHLACINGQSNLLDLLLSNKGDFNQKTSNGNTCAHFAAKCGFVSCLKILSKYPVSYIEQDNHQNTPLHWACVKSNTDVVEFVLQHISKDEITVGNIFTPLHCAAFIESIECLSLILNKIGSISYLPDIHGRTPLHYAVNNDDTLLAELLIQAGDGLNNQDFLGFTPVHVAAANPNRSLLNICITNNVDLSITDNNGNTPLHMACASSLEDNAYILMKNMKKEHLVLKNIEGYTAFDIAFTNELESITQDISNL